MPGIHPTSRRQIQYAFAAEKRGEFPKGTARKWAHNWKCWTNSEGPIPPGCKQAFRILEKVRSRA